MMRPEDGENQIFLHLLCTSKKEAGGVERERDAETARTAVKVWCGAVVPCSALWDV